MKTTTDKKILAIGVLSLTAAVLLLANYVAPQPVLATTTIKDRDFSMVTAATQTGGDSLYVLDNRTGRIAIYAYDPGRRQIIPRDIGEMALLFARGR